MQYVTPISFLVIGLAVGAVAVWLVLRTRIQIEYVRATAQGESEQAGLNERIQGRDMTIARLETTIEKMRLQLEEAQDALLELRSTEAQLKTTLVEERKQTKEKLEILNEAQDNLTNAFKALAADALKSNNDSFLKLATQTLESTQVKAKGDLEKRQQEIGQLVKPIKDALEKVDTKIQDLETRRAGAYAEIKEQVRAMQITQKELRGETANLVRALRSPAVRGRWGEIQLRRVVELAGMLEHCDFVEQQSIETDEGRLRPDMVVQLAGQRNIVVDAKAPLAAYLESIEAKDDASRIEWLEKHAEQIRTHIKKLSLKSYWDQFDTSPEFVVMFLPGEIFFSAAMQSDPELIECGVKQNIILASPTTLIALLRAVAYGWRQERLAESVKQISALGKELYERLATLGGHFSSLEKNLSKAISAYNSAVGSFESRVMVTARKFKELEVSPESVEIEELVPIEQAPRVLRSQELLPGWSDPSEE